MADNGKILEIIRAVSQTIEAHKDYLTELDQPIGDSDHGINMARGFEAVDAKLASMADKDVGTIFKNVGMSLSRICSGRFFICRTSWRRGKALRRCRNRILSI